MEGKHKLENVAIRMVEAPPLYSDEPVQTPEAAVRVLGRELETYDREVVCVVNLRSDLAPINMNLVSMGTVNESPASCREIFKSSILSNAACIMIAHNHPSGKMQPSKEDMALTVKVYAVAKMMGIPLVDHVIIGHGGEYFSFKKDGLLEAVEKEVGRAAKKKGSVMEAMSRYQAEQKGNTGHRADPAHGRRGRGPGER